MNKRVLALFLCCALVFGMVPVALSAAFSTGSDLTIHDSSGAPADSITLPQNDKTTLTAVAETDAGHYQWQIRVSDSVWANIAGSTETTLELSYAMVASLLKENSVDIRCRLTNDVNNVTYSNIVVVTVEAAPLRAAAKRAPAFGSVISGAEPIGEPVISEASDFVQSSPAIASAVQNVEQALAAVNDTSAQEPENNDGNDVPTQEQEPNGDSTNKEPSATSTDSTYSIVINYVFADGTQAAPSWTATVATGTTYQQEVKSPVVLGYTPDQETVQVNASAQTTYTVTYQAAEVDFTVKHYQQNVENDEYALVDTETKQGLTEAAVGEGLAKAYEGFYSLLYDTTTAIAADGSTEVNVYYDRYYYLMSFNLDGGYGVEPIYARYGAKIEVGTPTKPGYTFDKWDNTLPSTMPAESKTYTARWTPGTSGFTVVFWYENADDEGYSVAGSHKPADVAPGTKKTSEDYKNQSFDGRDNAHFTYNAEKEETVTVSGDGSTVLNVYFTRNTYTLTFKNGQITTTCGKEAHEHTYTDRKYFGYPNYEYRYNGGCYPTDSYSSTPICGKEEHVHSTGGCGLKHSDLKIIAKYGADIHGNFPINDSNGNTILWSVPRGCKSFKPGTYLASINTMPGEDITFSVYDQVSAATIWYYVEALNGEAGTHDYSGKHFILYKSVKYTKSGYLTYAEEFHDIIGFKQWASDPKFSSFDQDGRTSTIKDNNYLYYTRNSYNLKFYNYNEFVVENGSSVQYEAPLSSYNFTPDYPAGLEPNAYVFAGWYTTAGCYDGSEADLENMTMPASDVILYAKWTSKSHTVKTYLTKDVMENNEENTLKTWEEVPHGTVVTNPPEDPTNGEYKFVGWFYTGEDGKEKAFDFTMPVNRDLNLYAKWSSDVLVPYTIRYELEGGTEIAQPTNSRAPAGTTRTFDAKTGTQLNEGYQTGYFPKTASHSMTFNIEGSNEYTFEYVAREKVKYTVRYLEKDTGNELANPKTAETSDAVITEKFEQIGGYAPDAYQKRLVLSADEDQNIITFWYVKDELHAPVQIIHWTQNIAGDGYTEFQSYTNPNGIIDTEYTEAPLDIIGYRYNKTKSNPTGTLTAEGLVLNLYYDRIEYPYEFRFLEQGTENELADAVTGSARYGAQVTQKAKDIPGYTTVSGTYNQQNLTIAIEDPADKASKNVKTFYYVEDTVNITYAVVGPANSGKLDSYQDNGIGVINGTVNGATPTPAAGFKFVGWYKDKACTQPVETDWVDTNNKLTPEKTKNYGTDTNPVMGYADATYYAKFELDVADLTITKSGCQDIDENQSFLFDVTGPDGYSKRVVINGNGSVTIKGLKIGTYTVTEVTSWSWRYTGEKGTQTITLQPGESNAVIFKNIRTAEKWLGGDAYVQNKFTGTN